MRFDASAPDAPVSRSFDTKHATWLTHLRARWLPWGLALVIVAVTTRVGLRAVSDLSPWLHLRVGEWQPTSIRDPYAVLVPGCLRS